MKNKKIAILTSHPIQHQAPLFKLLSENKEGVAFKVYFCWVGNTVSGEKDSEFGVSFKWDIPLFDGYQYKFLKNISFKPSSGFWGQINPSIIYELWSNKYDGIIVLGWNSFTAWLVFLFSIFFRLPVVIRGENPQIQELLKTKTKLMLKGVVLGLLFKITHAFLYIGSQNRKFYKSFNVSDKKLFFAPYAINNDMFMRQAEELGSETKRIRKELLGPNLINNPTVVFSGKFIDKKRPMDLLVAAKILQDRGHFFNFLFIGDGELRLQMEEYKKSFSLDGVKIVGFVNQTELAKYYLAGDIFVLPSTVGETWGLVVNEAMCFSLPVIVSDLVGSAEDLVEDGKNGFVFPMGDTEVLADSIYKLKDEEIRKKFGRASRAKVENYSFKKDVEGFMQAIESI